jgi:acyl-CoA thioesterase
MEKNTKASAIINEMMKNDAYSNWLGIEHIEQDVGYSRIKMTVRPEMVNGFGIAHGGISYSFADSAFAFASNSQGRKSVSIETSISHLAAVQVGDTLLAVAREESLTHKIGVYTVEVTNQDNKLVALFKGTVYRSSAEWCVEN